MPLKMSAGSVSEPPGQKYNRFQAYRVPEHALPNPHAGYLSKRLREDEAPRRLLQTGLNPKNNKRQPPTPAQENAKEGRHWQSLREPETKLRTAAPQAKRNLHNAGANRIAVVIAPCLGGARRAEILAGVFTAPLFYPLSCGPPSHARESSDVIIQSLRTAAEQLPEAPVLVVKDSSVTALGPAEMERLIYEAMNAASADLYYLGRWGDRCQQHQDVTVDTGGGGSGPKLRWTFAPRGIQAVIFTPEARDIVLRHRPFPDGQYFSGFDTEAAISQAVEAGKFRAVCYTPSLVQFDGTLARSDQDFERLCECAAVTAPSQQATPPFALPFTFSTVSPYVWLAAAIVVILLFVFLIAAVAR